jgi:WD40 repeat protein
MRQHRADLETALRSNNPHIRNELLSMIVQYLEDAGYFSSALNLRDEVRLLVANDSARGKALVKLRGAITSGDWSQVEHVTTSLSANSSLLYCIMRHRFFELLAEGDLVTALHFLSTRLREYRDHEDVPGDFDRLSLMLVDSASPSQSSPLPNLVESTSHILEAIDRELRTCDEPLIEQSPPEHRLLDLLQQAVSFQFGNFPPRNPITSVVADFRPSVIPSHESANLPSHHTSNIKALAFIPGTNTLLSGSSDKSICVWNVSGLTLIGKLNGHQGRVWSVAAGREFAVTGSGDGTVRLWSVHDLSELAVFNGHQDDVYSVDVEPGGNRIVSGGYDQSIMLWDGSTQSPEACLKGHSESVTSVLFGEQTVVSGGDDLTVQLWDIRSCLATEQLSPVLGEVTSLAADSGFTKILAATRDNTNRIWDRRMNAPVVVLKGHRNAARHFVRARFAPDDQTVIGGSDDGKIYCWNATTGEIVDVIPAHPKGVFDIVWNSHGHCFASCGDDPDLHVWSPRRFVP